MKRSQKRREKKYKIMYVPHCAHMWFNQTQLNIYRNKKIKCVWTIHTKFNWLHYYYYCWCWCLILFFLFILFALLVVHWRSANELTEFIKCDYMYIYILHPCLTRSLAYTINNFTVFNHRTYTYHRICESNVKPYTCLTVLWTHNWH